MRAAALVTLVLCLSQPAFAQLAAAPNAKGVAFGHLGGTSTPFMKNLEASGIAIDRPYRLRRPGEQRLAPGYVLDPWGTAIEVTENLAPDKPGTH